MNTPDSSTTLLPPSKNNKRIITRRAATIICTLWIIVAAAFVVTTVQGQGLPAVTPTTLRINPNQATFWELTALPRIGDTKAAAIIDYRNHHVAYTQANDLQHVRGIGPKTTARLEPYLRFDR